MLWKMVTQRVGGGGDQKVHTLREGALKMGRMANSFAGLDVVDETLIRDEKSLATMEKKEMRVSGLQQKVVSWRQFLIIVLITMSMSSQVVEASQMVCKDSDDGATDPYGDGCAQYVANWCGKYNDADFASDVMCCVCGGGEHVSATVLTMSMLTDCAPVCLLNSTTLVGTIPFQVGTLTHIEILYLNTNTLTGPIPSELGMLSRCKDMRLSANFLAGTIATELGKLTQLQQLHMYGNKLQGEIASQIGSILGMQELYFDNNQLSGTIPSQIGSVTGMRRLHFNYNQLIGTIPSQIGSASGMKWLYLSNNRLTGTIPSQIGSPIGMHLLYLKVNQLIGTIPSQIMNLVAMQKLYLFSNQLTGTIPLQIGRLVDMQVLILDSNRFIGTIPSQIGSLTASTAFHAKDNDFTGPIPSQIGNCADMQRLDVSSNRLIGSIPSQIGKAVRLSYLYIYANHVTGTIPSQIGSITSMQYLYLQENRLTGIIPSQIGSALGMIWLYLSDNRLIGTIPSQIGNFALARYMILFSNQLTGTIPTQIGNFARLGRLHLYSNHLIGNIPSQLGMLTAMQAVNLDSNKLSGAIPSHIASLTRTQELHLDENKLTGTIPSQIGNLLGMQWIAIHLNKLIGTLPSQIGGLVALRRLYLDLNKLTGTIPSQIGLTGTSILGLFSNYLAGPIPSQIGNLNYMREMELRNNSLTGTIPSQIGNLVGMQKLILYSNMLTSTIPSQIGSLTRMQELKLYSNRLLGTIAEQIGRLTSLKELLLGDNILTGTFPNISGIKGLSTLSLRRNNFMSVSGPSIDANVVDVSENKFTDLPTTLFNLPSTSSLNLSYNQLSQWTFRGVVPSRYFNAAGISCGFSLQANDREPVKWPLLRYLDVSGNEFGGTVRDFLFSLSHSSSLVSVSARGCKMYGSLVDYGFGRTIVGTGDNACNHVPLSTTAFDSLYLLDLSHNFIEALVAAPRPWLAFASFDHNNISQINLAWWNWDKTHRIFELRVQQNPLLHQHVMPPRKCPATPRQFVSDVGFFNPPFSSAAYECTIPCRGDVSIQVDVTLNPEMLCRCRFGYGGRGMLCEACEVDHYEYHIGEYYTVTQCLSCPNHSSTETVANGSGILHCKCKAGYYMDIYSSICRRCIAGRFSASSGATECQPCETGKFAAENGTMSCVQCEIGFFANGLGSAACVACKKGTYMNYRGGTECQPCEVGEFAPESGTASCAQCDIGFVANSLGSAACVACKKGTYMNSRGGTECQTCEMGEFAPQIGTTSCAQCEIGFVANSLGSAACVACKKGTYMNSRGGAECQPCKAGEFAPENGTTSCAQCDIGFFANSLGSEACVSCKKGTHINFKGGTECKQCLGSMVASIGAAECRDCGFFSKPSQDHDDCVADAIDFVIVGVPSAVLLFIFAYVLNRSWHRFRSEKAFRVLLKDKKFRKSMKQLEMALNRSKKLGLKALTRDLLVQLSIQERKYVDLEALHQIVEERDMKVVRGSWVANETNGPRLQRQQDVPDDAFWNPHEFVSQMGALSVVAISYCWLHPVHPDPKGFHLEIVRHALKLRLHVKGPGHVTDVALFIDYCSIAQRAETGDPEYPEVLAERSDEEQMSFKAGLSVVNIPYANQRTETWILHWTPPEYEGREYDGRAWPSFEKTVSSLVKHPSQLMSMDDTTLQCSSWIDMFDNRIRRNAPYSPEVFREMIRHKKVTNGSDVDILIDVYNATFAEVIGNAVILWFVSQEWGDDEAQRIAEIFPYCTRLKEVLLSENEFTSQAATVIVEAAVKCVTLVALDLMGNPIGKDAIPVIERIWSSAGKPHFGLHMTGARKRPPRSSTRELRIEPTSFGLVKSYSQELAAAALRAQLQSKTKASLLKRVISLGIDDDALPGTKDDMIELIMAKKGSLSRQRSESDAMLFSSTGSIEAKLIDL